MVLHDIPFRLSPQMTKLPFFHTLAAFHDLAILYPLLNTHQGSSYRASSTNGTVMVFFPPRHSTVMFGPLRTL